MARFSGAASIALRLSVTPGITLVTWLLVWVVARPSTVTPALAAFWKTARFRACPWVPVSVSVIESALAALVPIGKPVCELVTSR